MPHSQGLSNNPYPEPNQPNSPTLIPISSRSILILSSHRRLGLPKGLFLQMTGSKSDFLEKMEDDCKSELRNAN